MIHLAQNVAMITREKLDCSEDELQEKLNKYNYIKILNPKWLDVVSDQQKSQIVPITDKEFSWCEDYENEGFKVKGWAIGDKDEDIIFLEEFNKRDYIFVTDKYAENYLNEKGYTQLLKDN